MTSTCNEANTSQLSLELLTCEECGSTLMVHTLEGISCRECGLVSNDYLSFANHYPYKEASLQHAPKGKTQIGSYKERITHSHSPHVMQLDRVDSYKTHEERVEFLARSELKRILSGLRMGLSEESNVLYLFWKLYRRLDPKTKYRSAEKLIPIAIYIHYKLICMVIHEEELLMLSRISKTEFNDFKVQIRDFIPYYYQRNRQEYVFQKLLDLQAHFGLDMEFYHSARKVLEKFWNVLKNTTDKVITGVCASVVALCSPDIDLHVNAICTYLDCQMSTINAQVKKNFFKRFRIKGYTSLVKSSITLRKLMEHSGIFNPIQLKEVNSIIEIKLGSSRTIFNPNKNEKYYLLMIQHSQSCSIIITISPNEEKTFRTSPRPAVIRDHSIDMTCFLFPSGPPIIGA